MASVMTDAQLGEPVGRRDLLVDETKRAAITSGAPDADAPLARCFPARVSRAIKRSANADLGVKPMSVPVTTR